MHTRCQINCQDNTFADVWHIANIQVPLLQQPLVFTCFFLSGPHGVAALLSVLVGNHVRTLHLQVLQQNAPLV